MVHSLKPARILSVLLAALAVAGGAAAQAPAPAPASSPSHAEKAGVSDVRNFTTVDATLACGGALGPEAIDSLRRAGFKSIVNLRDASEPGANVPDERAAAEKAGLKYIHLPFSNAKPEAARVDEFLKAFGDRSNLPMMLHCASGGRASVFWAIKRVLVDGWTVEKAFGEMPDLVKNVSEPVRAFALEYIKSHGKTRP